MKPKFYWLFAFSIVAFSSLACVIELTGPLSHPVVEFDEDKEYNKKLMLTLTAQVSEPQDFTEDSSGTDFTSKQAGTHTYNVSAKTVTSNLCTADPPIQTRTYDFSDGQVELIFPSKTEVFYKTGENEYTLTYPASYLVTWYEEDGETVSSIEEIEYEAKRVIEFSDTSHTIYLYGPESVLECYWVYTLIE